MHHSWLWRVLLVISILLALLFAPPSQAQGVPACTMGDLDITPQIADGPNNTYTLAVNFTNFSQHACSLNRSADEPSFYFQSAPSASLFVRCVSSKECAPSRASVGGPGLTLDPGAVGHQRYSWKTSPAVPDGPCVMAYRMDNSVNGYGHFNIMSPSLLRLICSPVIVGPYKPGAFPPDYRATAGETQRAPTVRIIPAEDKYYERERHVRIRAVIDDPGELLYRESHFCPALLVRQEHWPSWVNFEEVRQKPCKVEPSGAVIQAEAVLEGGLARGGYDLALFAVVALRNRQLMVIASPQFRLNTADPATMERKWGPQLKGVAVSLMLDRNRYDLGEDIPLHIAVENFAAEDSIAADREFPLVEIELRDECSQEIEPSGGTIWTSHGGQAEFLKGEIVPQELTLGDFGLLPDAPGTYTVVAIWRAFRGVSGVSIQTDAGGESGKPYATVESVPVAFQIVDPEHPQTTKASKCGGVPAGKPN